MLKSLRWDDLNLFLAVAEERSLSGAARRLKISQPTLSRRIQQLEAQAGEPLFLRNAQGTPPTPAGERLLPAAQRMAEWAVEAAAALEPGRTPEQGTVRVAAPAGIATAALLPVVARLRLTHPGLQVQLLCGAQTPNLGRGEADLALRTQRPTDSGLEILDEVTHPLHAYASADYIRRQPRPRRLKQIEWITWAPPYEHLNKLLQSRIGKFQSAFCSDDFLVMMEACRRGVGALILARTLVRNPTQSGLVPINLPQLDGLNAPLYLVAHQRHRSLSKLRPVISEIRSEFGSIRLAPAATL